uniref:Uncharacterized protein n=1 Tax=Caulerpa ashmeadii TaxID=177078 RepID=A0A6B9VZ15_9CHLO|nr:hypothetical protein [Caulerpa ashmeadii]QHQ73329.1 hypothetical protein [Caulerpa ashmeadii]
MGDREWEFQQELEQTNLDLFYANYGQSDRFFMFISRPYDALLTSASFGRHQLSEDYEITLCLMKDEILEAKELLKAKSVNQTGPPSEGVLDRQLAQYWSLLQFDESGPKNEARELELSKARFADFIR